MWILTTVGGNDSPQSHAAKGEVIVYVYIYCINELKFLHFFAKYKGEFKKDYYGTTALITESSGT